MPYGLKDIELAKLNEVFAANKRIERVVLYGSRAKGNYKPFSDVDITLEGSELTHNDLSRLSLAIDDLLLPYQFDISIFHTLKNEALIDHIRRMGITIFEKKSEWKEYKLGEIAEITSSKRIFYSEYVPEGIPFYRSKEIIDLYNKRNVSSELFISETRYNEIKDKFGVPKENDILLTSVGSLGIPYKVKKSDKFYFKDGNLTWFKDINRDLLLPDYLMFWLTSSIGKQKLDEITIGSTQAALTISGLKTITIELPSISEQRSIVSILSSLDDKIDLLHRENATLEQMAETLFRQWFVMEAKEEWEEGKLGDLIVVKYGKDHKKLLDGKIPVIGSGGIMRYADTALYNKESVLIPRKGTLNNVIYINEPFWTVDTMFYTEMRRPNIAKYVFHFMKGQDLANMNVGSAVPSMTTEVLNNILVDIPPQEVFDKFENAVVSLYNKKEQNKKQIQTIIQTRDGLLPRLMSGELKI